MDTETKKAFKETNANIEKLATAVKHGFDSVDKRFEQVDKRIEQVGKRFEQVDKRFEKIETTLTHMNARMLTIERDVAEIRAHFVYREEFEDLMARVRLLEKKAGIASGK